MDGPLNVSEHVSVVCMWESFQVHLFTLTQGDKNSRPSEGFNISGRYVESQPSGTPPRQHLMWLHRCMLEAAFAGCCQQVGEIWSPFFWIPYAQRTMRANMWGAIIQAGAPCTTCFTPCINYFLQRKRPHMHHDLAMAIFTIFRTVYSYVIHVIVVCLSDFFIKEFT